MINFLAAQGRRLDRVQADGNCLFRSLSKQLFNDEKYHCELRKMLIGYAESIPELISGWAIEGLSLQEHLRRMKIPKEWGSKLEIVAAATMFRKTIYVASDSLVPGECQWISFFPLSTSKLFTPSICSKLPEIIISNQAWLEIAYSNQCHYDAIYTSNWPNHICYCVFFLCV